MKNLLLVALSLVASHLPPGPWRDLAGSIPLADEPLPAVTPPPAALGLDPWYQKYVDAAGVPVVASARVSDDALQVARLYAVGMLGRRADVRAAMIRNHIRIVIIGVSERTTEIPEYRTLPVLFPGTDWDTRGRAYGATPFLPVSSAAEENLLAQRQDAWRGENIFAHEFGHSIADLGLKAADPAFAGRLDAAYRNAMAKGLFANTYAATNASEYWAEGVQDWFDLNLSAVPANGIHNEIHTREQLKAYDPELADLLAAAFP